MWQVIPHAPMLITSMTCGSMERYARFVGCAGYATGLCMLVEAHRTFECTFVDSVALGITEAQYLPYSVCTRLQSPLHLLLAFSTKLMLRWAC